MKEELAALVEPYETAAIEPGEDGTYSVSVSDGSVLAFWVPTKRDAIAIKFGLQMFATAIKEGAAAERKIVSLAERILEASKAGPWHGDGLSQEAIDRLETLPTADITEGAG